MTSTPAPGLAGRLHELAALPSVADAVERARAACTALRWHQALRRRIPEAAAESRVRGAQASALLEGVDVPLAHVRDLMRGAQQWPVEPDPLLATLRGCIQATAEAERVSDYLVRSPTQALARLHVAAAAALLPAEELGRPRRAGEDVRELIELGLPAPPETIAARLAGVGRVVAVSDRVPALIAAAVVHGELAVTRPFVRGNAVVARAFERALLKQGGVDPTGVAVSEVGHGRAATTGYVGALAAYATGSAEGIGLWLEHCAEAVATGAAEGVRVADAVLAGRLS